MAVTESSQAALASEDQDETALRWRRAILDLSETFLCACDERSDLSPILMEAMHSALENLLVYGEANDLMALEEWLHEEKDGPGRRLTEGRTAEHSSASHSTAPPGKQFSEALSSTTNQPLESAAAAGQPATEWPAVERRVNGERRVTSERRSAPRASAECRSGRDRRATSVPGLFGSPQDVPRSADDGSRIAEATGTTD